MPAVPSSIIGPICDQFAALLPAGPVTHPLGCHRPRIADRVVFDKLVQVLVFGCAYHRIADETFSATTLRRRRDEWIAAGVMDRLHGLVLAGYDRVIGLALPDVAVDCCITKAPCGGEGGSEPGGSRQAGLERSGRRRRRRYPTRCDSRAGQSARFAAAGSDAGHHWRSSAAGRGRRPPRSRLRFGVTRARIRARGILAEICAGQAGPGNRGRAVGGRAHQRLDQCALEVRLVYRASRFASSRSGSPSRR